MNAFGALHTFITEAVAVVTRKSNQCVFKSSITLLQVPFSHDAFS